MKRLLLLLLMPLAFFACTDPGPSQELGEECMADGDCYSDVCLDGFDDGTEFDGACTIECSGPGSCNDGWTCLNYTATEERLCYPQCQEDSDCAPGWVCECIWHPLTCVDYPLHCLPADLLK